MNLSDYETIGDYWHDLDALLKDKPKTPVPRKFYQQQLVAESASWLFVARGVFGGRGLTSIKAIKITRPRVNNEVTKLDFVDQKVDGQWQKYGHLILTGNNTVKAHGIHVVEIGDIPVQQQAEINEAVDLLLAVT